MWFRPLLCIALFARLADAQAGEQPGTTVSGVVRDSIARTPLVGAVVQLVAVDSAVRVGRSALSDSLGRFTLTDVPAGRYTLGFFHPMLDSLGLEPPTREVLVDGRQPVAADLAIPSPARLRAAICGPQSSPAPGALVMGIIRDARTGAAAGGVTVTGEWLEFSIAPGILGRRIPRVVATTAESGWFAMCDVPGAGTIALMATRGADSTDLIEAEVPEERFLRRELYLGPGRAAGPHAGQLTGTVVTAGDGTPLAGAVVRMPSGPGTRANERGEWALADVPVGTRMLEVRAIGYYPERSVVDVMAGTAPIRTTLATLQSTLDTVRITASRLTVNMRGFEERRRSGTGRYLTAEYIADRRPFFASEILRMVPSIRVDRNGPGETAITMRGHSVADRCSPAVYMDGNYMSILSADDIDNWVTPEEIAGIEIYTGPGIPPQFNKGLADSCGSIVIWTKPRKLAYRSSWKIRMAKILGLAVIALFVERQLPR